MGDRNFSTGKVLDFIQIRPDLQYDKEFLQTKSYRIFLHPFTINSSFFYTVARHYQHNQSWGSPYTGLREVIPDPWNLMPLVRPEGSFGCRNQMDSWRITLPSAGTCPACHEEKLTSRVSFFCAQRSFLMRIILNGIEEVCPGHESLTDLLNRKGAETDRLVVERNGVIIPRNQWPIEIVEADDIIEVVRLVGGG